MAVATKRADAPFGFNGGGGLGVTLTTQVLTGDTGGDPNNATIGGCCLDGGANHTLTTTNKGSGGSFGGNGWSTGGRRQTGANRLIITDPYANGGNPTGVK